MRLNLRLNLTVKTEAGMAAKTLEMAYQDMQQVRDSAAATIKDKMCAQRALTAAKAANDAWAAALFMEATDFMPTSPARLDHVAEAREAWEAETEPARAAEARAAIAAAAEVLAANNRKREV